MPTTEGTSGLGLRASVRAALDAIGPGLYGVACSGGADSMALAHATIACAGAQNVVVVTIDHALSPRSGETAEAVATWAKGQGAAAVVRRIEVPRRASLEAAAREARYAALTEIADELGLACVLLGHTARDQAETVLLRIVRGTGPAGLAGMPERRGIFARPFLQLPRAEIEAYAAQLPVIEDPMNDDTRFTRVRLRAALRAENPSLDDALLRLAASAREWTEAIDQYAEPFAHFPIDCPALASQPAAIRKRALALALDRAGIDYSARHLDALDALVTSPTRGERSLDLPGTRLVRTYDQLDLAEVRSPRSEVPHVPAGHELRAWRPGDRMGSRKLSDLYIDAKVPRSIRQGARVLVRRVDGAIVWAEFIGAAYKSF